MKSELENIEIQENYPLLDKNSLGVPAVCDAYVEIKDSSELGSIINYASRKKLSIYVLGEGTNLVLGKTVPGLVVKVNILGKEIVEETPEFVRLSIGAGENWHDFVSWCLERGYPGLENLALIPGSCGAAPVQNIGAYGVEICQFVDSVEYIDLATRQVETLSNSECLFGYRDSIFKQDLYERALITRVELVLQKNTKVDTSYPALTNYLSAAGMKSDPLAIFKAVCAIRSSKLPDIHEVPNVGSFFKNPVVGQDEYRDLLTRFPQMPGYVQIDPELPDVSEVKIPAAWLIDHLGWKGKIRSGVGVHDKQALVIVNPGHRTGDRVIDFADKISMDVEKEFGIRLEIEPRTWAI